MTVYFHAGTEQAFYPQHELTAEVRITPEGKAYLALEQKGEGDLCLMASPDQLKTVYNALAAYFHLNCDEQPVVAVEKEPTQE